MAVLSLLGLALLVGLLISSSLALSRAVEEAAQLRVATTAVQDLETALLDQDAAVRGYALTGDQRFLGVDARARERQLEAEAALAPLLTDAPDAAEGLLEVDERALQWRREAAEPRLRGEVPVVVTTTREAGLALQAKERFDEVREELRVLQEQVRAMGDAGDEAVRAAQRRLLGALALAVGGGAGVLVSSALLYTRWVALPVERLATAVRSVSGGHHPEPLAVRGPTEIRSLAGDVERMRQEVVAQTAAAQRADEALLQQAGAVAALRAALRPAMPPVEGLRAVGHLEPAEGVLAGDWYDVLDLGDGCWAALVVDVSGHGAAAGTLALRLRTLLIPALRTHASPADAVAWTVRSVGSWDDLFATAVVVVGRPDGRVSYVGCGHPPAVLCRRGTVLLPPTGPLLSSLTEGETWGEHHLRLGVGDRLLLYTDGVVEARDATGEEFGEERLLALACAAPAASGRGGTGRDGAGLSRSVSRSRDDALGPRDATAVVEACLDALHAWSGTSPRDDRTLLVLEHTEPA